MVYLLKMVIFHGYVKLPEGIPFSLSALVLSIPGRGKVLLQLELNRVGSSRAFVAA